MPFLIVLFFFLTVCMCTRIWVHIHVFMPACTHMRERSGQDGREGEKEEEGDREGEGEGLEQGENTQKQIDTKLE